MWFDVLAKALDSPLPYRCIVVADDFYDKALEFSLRFSDGEISIRQPHVVIGNKTYMFISPGANVNTFMGCVIDEYIALVELDYDFGMALKSRMVSSGSPIS